MATPKKGITVRFEDDEMKQIEDLAARYYVNSTTIIRWALKALADYVAANDGKITLPLDFSAFFRNASEAAAAHSRGTPEGRSTYLNDEPNKVRQKRA